MTDSRRSRWQVWLAEPQTRKGALITALVVTLALSGPWLAPPTADWGLMINENQAGLLVQPWAVLAPAILIGIFAYGTNILAEGIGRSSSRIGEKQP